jgi:hypothetical protein
MKHLNLTKAFLLLIITITCLYYVKAKYFNINLTPYHLGDLLEEKSGGLLKCAWFPNPHHCSLFYFD